MQKNYVNMINFTLNKSVPVIWPIWITTEAISSAFVKIRGSKWKQTVCNLKISSNTLTAGKFEWNLSRWKLRTEMSLSIKLITKLQSKKGSSKLENNLNRPFNSIFKRNTENGWRDFRSQNHPRFLFFFFFFFSHSSSLSLAQPPSPSLFTLSA